MQGKCQRRDVRLTEQGKGELTAILYQRGHIAARDHYEIKDTVASAIAHQTVHAVFSATARRSDVFHRMTCAVVQPAVVGTLYNPAS